MVFQSEGVDRKVVCDDTIAVANKEGWDNSKDFWWKVSVDRSKPIQCKADLGAYSVSCILNLRDLGPI